MDQWNTSMSFIAAEKTIPELTLRSVILAIILTIVLAMANAYLALKIGILTSASIPAAVISMGILHFFKNSTLLENNCVQTSASAGEAIAGGIVYTIPALIIIQYWHQFAYWENFFIAFTGGVLGVIFSIPLRRILVKEKSLPFPEGQAIAEVLMSSAEKKLGLRNLVYGGVLGGLIELFQVGFKIIASSWSAWFVVKRVLFGFGAGFSATLIGAGYLIGFEVAVSICLGAIIAWLVTFPVMSILFPHFIIANNTMAAVTQLWNEKIRYIGIGAMLFAGIWTFVFLIKPLIKSLKLSFSIFTSKEPVNKILRTDRDIPLPYLLFATFLLSALIFLFFQSTFPFAQTGLSGDLTPSIVFLCVLFVFIVGFVFSAITGYFSGMVGVTASPGSAIIIAGMLMAAWLLLKLLNFTVGHQLSDEQIKAAEAITIIIGAVITGIAAIANDNMQDLKVGYILGATPWKQQLMLLLGVTVSALVIPPIMQLLFSVYGIAGVMPHAGMDSSQSLPAPPAAIMAAITQAVFHRNLPWPMMYVGSGVILSVVLVNQLLSRYQKFKFSILGVAIGMYLPLSSSFPLFLGGMIAWLVNRKLASQDGTLAEKKSKRHLGVLLACGLVAGAALMEVILAVPFSFYGTADALSLTGENWQPIALILALLTTFGLIVMFYRTVKD